MTTASTRSRNRKQKRRAEQMPPKGMTEEAIIAGKDVPGEPSERVWRIGSISVMAIAAFLRLYNLNLVPLHHDEGVNGNFLVRLVREGFYQYDPANYHGPTIYYFAAIIPWTLRFLFGTSAQNAYGLTTVTIRLIPAFFGIVTIWLVLLLRKRLGTIGALSAALLLAISPGAVYLSRYFIHETLFVFFTLGVVVAGLNYWEDGHPVYLILASASAALLFATKETAIISAAVLVIALVVSYVYHNFRRRDLESGRERKRRAVVTANASEPASPVERLGGPRKIAVWGVIAILVFVLINVLFYSSFFTNYPKGVYDSLRTFDFWTKTGQQAHVHPLTTYISWLIRQEFPILFLGSIGAALLVWRPRNYFALFCAVWGVGILAAYSLIAYKTPWLALNFIVPLAMAGGYSLQMIWNERLGQIRMIVALLVLAVGLSGYQMVDLNFFNYDNDSQYYVYVYAHTRRDTLAMLKQIDQVAERTKQGKLTGITIIAPEYWPLPWYLRDYTRVGYHGQITTSTEPVIIAAEGQGGEIEAKFGSDYKQVSSGLNPAGSYSLRPGVSFLLYVRRDVP
ncbi:MAG: flippase activity-associated protein Agl23 [Acidobacteriota bacterium]